MRIAFLAAVFLAVLAFGLAGMRHAQARAEEPKAVASASQDEGRFDSALASSKPVLVEFTATWCPSCRSVAATVDHFAQESADHATVLQLDVDLNSSLGVKYHVREIPCFIAFAGGREVARQTGELSLDGMRRLMAASQERP